MNGMVYYVYILESETDGSLYTGQTNNLRSRFRRHNRGLIKATKAKTPYRMGYFEIYGKRAEAMRREWELKTKWNTERKKRLIRGFDPDKIKEVLGL